MVVAVGLSALLVSQLISRNTDEPGILVAKWHAIMKVIGDDVPDKRKR